MFEVHCCIFCGKLPPVASKEGPFHPYRATLEDGREGMCCASCAEEITAEQASA